MKVNCFSISILCIILFSLYLQSCKESDAKEIKDDINITGFNELVQPETIFPEDEANEINTNMVLKWSPINTDNSSIRYNVYLDSEPGYMTLVGEDIRETELEVSGLLESSLYYWQVVAINESGAKGFSKVNWFTTQFVGYDNGSFIDSRDGRLYKYIKIDQQYWMAENLNFGVYENLPDPMAYDLHDTNADKYGKLYRFSYATNLNPCCGCPDGWRLPTLTEWENMLSYWGGLDDKNLAKKLKNQSGWENTNGTNESGFNALPGGFCDLRFEAPFFGKGTSTNWWADSTYRTEGVNPMKFRYAVRIYEDTVSIKKVLDLGADNYRYSVRCVKD